jgi:hypothetical protein
MGARQLARDGLKTQLDAFLAANPTIVGRTYRTRPASPELPCGYVGSITENVDHDSGTRSRRLDALVQFEKTITDNELSGDWTDDIADGFLDLITDNHDAITGGMTQVMRIASDSEEASPEGYRTRVDFTIRIELIEGRS